MRVRHSEEQPFHSQSCQEYEKKALDSDASDSEDLSESVHRRRKVILSLAKGIGYTL